MVVRRDTLLRRAEAVKRASSRVAFRDLDPRNELDWGDLVVDLAALANSGGGVIVLDDVVDVDRRHVAERIAQHTGTRFDAVAVREVTRDGRALTAIVIDATTEAPLLVGQQAYFRHGAKSKPATSDDLRKFFERRVDLVRRQWLRSIREVLIAPEGAHVAVVETAERDEHGEPTVVRLSTDPSAPLYGRLDPDRTHPYRQTEVVAEVNRRLPEGASVNPYEILSVRRIHGISEDAHPEFTHVPKFGSPQYSDAFVDWILEQHTKDRAFFAKAKAEYTRTARSRRAASS